MRHKRHFKQVSMFIYVVGYILSVTVYLSFQQRLWDLVVVAKSLTPRNLDTSGNKNNVKVDQWEQAIQSHDARLGEKTKRQSPGLPALSCSKNRIIKAKTGVLSSVANVEWALFVIVLVSFLIISLYTNMFFTCLSWSQLGICIFHFLLSRDDVFFFFFFPPI